MQVVDLDLDGQGLAAALHVISGGPLRLLEPTSGLRHAFARVLPSASELRCDGCKPGTLLGAIPGLSAAGLAAHGASLNTAMVSAGFRFVLRSYEIDCVAPSAELARLWVRGVNHLPFGGKQRQLATLARGSSSSR